MPYKHVEMKLVGTSFDARVKLTEQQREEIRKQHRAGTSQRELARSFKVSRRLISFIIYPDRLADNLRRRAERGGSKQYYVKEKHTKYMKKHRRRKQKIYVSKKVLDKKV